MQSLAIWKTFGKGYGRRVADIEVTGVAKALADMGASDIRIKADAKREAEAAQKAAKAAKTAKTADDTAKTTGASGVSAGGAGGAGELGGVVIDASRVRRGLSRRARDASGARTRRRRLWSSRRKRRSCWQYGTSSSWRRTG